MIYHIYNCFLRNLFENAWKHWAECIYSLRLLYALVLWKYLRLNDKKRKKKSQNKYKSHLGVRNRHSKVSSSNRGESCFILFSDIFHATNAIRAFTDADKWVSVVCVCVWCIQRHWACGRVRVAFCSGVMRFPFSCSLIHYLFILNRCIYTSSVLA